MSLYETKKILPDTTRAEIETVINTYKEEIKSLKYDLEDGQISNVGTQILQASMESIQKNITQLEAILVEFYEAKCSLCDHHQKMDIRTMKFICGKHDNDGREVILQW